MLRPASKIPSVSVSSWMTGAPGLMASTSSKTAGSSS